MDKLIITVTCDSTMSCPSNPKKRGRESFSQRRGLMRGAVLKEIGKPFAIEDVPVPSIGPDEALIETHTCGICRTDIHIQDGLAYVPQLPLVPGHEPAGVVVDVGQNVRNVKVGQRVVPHLFVRSRDCPYTRAGCHAQATHLEGIIGVTMPAGFAEYFKAPAGNLPPLPDGVPFDAGGLTRCAVITAVHAYRKAALQAGDTAVVLGPGGIGLILVQMLKATGVRVVAMARSPESLDLAARAGAALTVRADAADAADQARRFAGAESDGVQCAFEMVGLAKTMKLAAACVMHCGKIIVIGEEAESPAIDTIQIAQRELQIIGSRNGGLQDAIDALDMMANGVIHPPIAKRFPLDEVNDAMHYVHSGQAHGRVVVIIK